MLFLKKFLRGEVAEYNGHKIHSGDYHGGFDACMCQCSRRPVSSTAASRVRGSWVVSFESAA